MVTVGDNNNVDPSFFKHMVFFSNARIDTQGVAWCKGIHLPELLLPGQANLRRPICARPKVEQSNPATASLSTFPGTQHFTCERGTACSCSRLPVMLMEKLSDGGK